MSSDSSVPTDSNPPIQKFPRHDPRLLQNSVNMANDFYQWDKQLTTADRRKLSNYFWQKLAIFPLIGLPVMVGFIVSPNYLKKRGVLDPKKRYRFLQIGLGFFGLGAGFQVSNVVSSAIHMQLLRSNPPAQNAYNILRQYPPQLGARYYGMTAATPELAMKDPHNIDWKTNPLFPIILVMNRDVIKEFKRANEDRYEKYREMRQNQIQHEIDERSNRGNSGSEEPKLTGTSWDHVIAGNNNVNSNSDSGSLDPSRSGYSSSSSDGRGYPTSRGGKSSGSPSNLPSFSGSGADWLGSSGDARNAKFPSSDSSDISDEQRKFDEMLDRERQQSMEDDFSKSEEKWD